MKIMVIGSGGREHALAWKAARSGKVDEVFVVPGNAGTETEPGLTNIKLDTGNFDALSDFAIEHGIGLTIVGPEAPLVEGLTDHFQHKGLRCFGPGKGAAQLEGSKAFTKDFLQRHNIPTAAYANFTDTATALAYLERQSIPIVIKADGLAAGKGVIIADTMEKARETVIDMLAGNSFGEAGHRVVIEEFMQGEEASFIAIVDGNTALPFATSQDHKARDDGDRGPNTGGMGAYSPAPVVTADVYERVMEQIIRPTVRGMAEEGNTYVGFLYAGLMIDKQGNPRVVEFNCRFGDPEAQPVMMRLETDLVELCEAALDQQLSSTTITFDERAAVGVVLASGGYPDAYEKGKVITGLDADTSIPDSKIFHAGTMMQGQDVVTSGGRVLCATALGSTVTEAQHRAYQLARQISWENIYYRNDIAYRAVAREQQNQ